MSSSKSNRRPAGKPAPKSAGKQAPKPAAKQPIDPLLAQRLDQLGKRRPAGSPLPPPTPGSGPHSAGRPAAARPAPLPGSQEAKLAAAAERAAAARAAKQAGGRAPAPTKRTKPAAASKVASLAISAATTLALAGMFARQDNGATDSVILTAGTDPTAATTAAASSGTTATTAAATDDSSATTATTAPAASSTGTIADGTYVGEASQNRFGTVQVQVVYSGGQIVDVQILSYPDGDRRSISINQRSLPTLIDEAIAAQSADINGVGGATYTSRSYVASLQSAIDNAKQASGVTG